MGAASLRTLLLACFATCLLVPAARADESPLAEAIVKARAADESQAGNALALATLLERGVVEAAQLSASEGLPPGDGALKRRIFPATKRRFETLLQRLNAIEEAEQAATREALRQESCFAVRVLQSLASPQAAKEVGLLRAQCWKNAAAEQYWRAVELAAKEPQNQAIVISAAQGFQRLVAESKSDADRERLAWIEQHLGWFKAK